MCACCSFKYFTEHICNSFVVKHSSRNITPISEINFPENFLSSLYPPHVHIKIKFHSTFDHFANTLYFYLQTHFFEFQRYIFVFVK